MRQRMLCLAIALAAAAATAAPAAADFPAADSGYHNYTEVTDETLAIANAHPTLVQRVSIGKSFGGLDIWALKVSDNVAVDEDEPEALFDSNQHAREHLTVEMAMYLLNELTSRYATDARIRNVVDTREIWIVPTVNPDGAEYDVTEGSGYRQWRKNMQPGPGAVVGTDLNRNWGWQWGCCNGSSADPASQEFRGTAAFSAPETRALRDFVLSRRIAGVQQIKVSIDFHSYGELVMWPYAYTFADVAPGMTQDQHDAFAALGQSMAQSNGYTPQQASDLYISDGNLRDWLWGQEGIFAYGFEMYPTTMSPGFYPPDEAIAAQTSRNREAILRLLEAADCPYRAAGLQGPYCGEAGGPTGPPGPTGPAAPPPAPSPPPPPPPAAPAGADDTAATTLRATRAGFDARGRVRLRVRCATIGQTLCRGTLKLRVRLAGGARDSTIAATNYVIATGASTVALRIGPAGRRALRRRTAMTVTAVVTTRQDATGAHTSTSTRVRLVRKR